MRRALLLAPTLIAIATPAIANATTIQAYHYAPCGNCGGTINGLSPPYNATRVRMRRSATPTSWTSSGGNTNGIGEFFTAFATQSGGTIVTMEVGYARDAYGCGGTTAGAVKLVYSAWIGGTEVACGNGQVISTSEEHDLKIAACHTTDWCAYLDGTQLIDWGDLGITGNVYSVEELGQAASGTGAAASVDWGGSTTPLGVSTNDGSSWTNVRATDQAWVDNSTPWTTDPFSASSAYTVAYSS